MKGRGLLFGLNYDYAPDAKLYGCINDVVNMSFYLKNDLGIPVDIYTDDVDRFNTSGMGIMKRLYELAIKTHTESLDFVWIHYSGHGTNIVDTSKDEADGYDECIVPSDFKTKGVLSDDFIKGVFHHFNPKTRIVCVFDCCHSATICDVKYSWEGPMSAKVENIMCRIPSKMITISGCLDNQTSADAYNIMKNNQYSGALTTCLLRSLTTKGNTFNNNVFELIENLRKALKESNFDQVPKLCSTFNLALDPKLLPINLTYE